MQKLYDRLGKYERFWESVETGSFAIGASSGISAFVVDGPIGKVGGVVAFTGMVCFVIATYLDERCKQRKIEIDKCLTHTANDPVSLEKMIREHRDSLQF